ncbi:MAG TPA: SDR family oxidoreductase [Stenotrophomonas sp.]|nr:SDR family oxidoreductase [Stenotrophomonas sp.]
MSSPRILITGATGQLGRLVIAELLQRLPDSQLAVAVRDPLRASDLAAQGLDVRTANYDDPEALERAMAGIERVLLIASNELGQRSRQHRNVIGAASRAGVRFVAFTSLLHADGTPIGLGVEYRDTEAALRESGLAFAVLRNGWYTENITATAPLEVVQGVRAGAAGQGRFSTAARADYAAAAAVVLTTDVPSGHIYELAGDDSFDLAEYAATLSRVAGKPVHYENMRPEDYRNHLLAAGLPQPLTELLADWDAGAAQNALFDQSRTLSQLIGRPTTPLETSLRAALAG